MSGFSIIVALNAVLLKHLKLPRSPGAAGDDSAPGTPADALDARKQGARPRGLLAA
jgi:hypothetical protein